MKRTILAAILATAAIAFSCTMNEEPGALKSGSVVNNPTATIAEFVAAGPSTKTTMTLVNNVAKYAFEESDILGAFPVSPEVGDCHRFTVKENKGTSCIFDGGGFALLEGQQYAAYYPAPANVVEVKSVALPAATAVPVDFTNQSQPEAGVWNLSNVDFLYATGIEPENGACSFEMQHLGALLMMDVTFEEAGVYKALVLESSETFIVTGAVDLTPNAEDFFVCEDVDETMTLTLGGDNGMAVEAGATVRFFMMVAPDEDQEGAELTLSVIDANDNEIVVKKGTGFAFESGKAYKFGCTLESPGNLSRVGTSNCYIVDVNNLVADGYNFDATVAGNGTAGIVTFPSEWAIYDQATPAVGTCAISGAGAKLHWAENNCIKDVYYEDGKIFFTATGAEGNAKVSLTEGENGTGNIVWNWIIWCTDQPGTVTYNAPTAPNNQFTVLDRNIGAITNGPIEEGHDAREMAGLYYQWGNPIGYSVDEFHTVRDGYQMVSTFSRPTVPYDRSDYTWFNPNAGGVGGSVMAELWGSGIQPNFLNIWPASDSYKKTIYDPCPVGYKVAPPDFLREFNDSDDSSELTVDCFGMYIQGTDGKVFFPYTGAMYDGFSSTPFSWPAGDHGYTLKYWTSGSSGNGGNGSNMAWCWEASQRNETRISYGKTTTEIVVRGKPIRCVVE